MQISDAKTIRNRNNMLEIAECILEINQLNQLEQGVNAHIVVKGTITVTNPDNNAYDKKLAFKSNAAFVSCISKINNTLIDNAEDLDIVMPTYNLLEYSKCYSKTTGRFSNYYRDEPNWGVGGANNNINYLLKDSKSFDYKTCITRKLEGNRTEKEVEIVAPLKHLSNFGEHFFLEK